MKVIKEGRKQTGWAKEFECTGKGNGGGGCGAILLVEQSDVYRMSCTDYGGDIEVYNTFKCSQCGVETDIGHVPFVARYKYKEEIDR
jgi:hypothetical protein